jgi:cyclin H
MIEDDFYRASTQYRHWSFTRAQLAEQRKNTNALAASRVRAAFQRAQAANGDAKTDDDSNDAEVDTLTAEEELKIIEWGSSMIVQMGELLRVPPELQVCGFSFQTFIFRQPVPVIRNPNRVLYQIQ